MAPKNTRPTLITGNWKMYKTIEEAVGFVETLAPLLKNSQATVCLAVPFTAIYATVQRVKELQAPIKIGAQNMNDASEGAFTGEIAARMLLDVGAQFAILGHSERRHIFQESSSFINRKVKRAIATNLQPVLCVGETLEERESGKTEEVLKSQILESLKGIPAAELSELVLAYEPVWAIGTGKVADPTDAEQAHRFCRELIAKKWGKRLASRLVIQYGGSVKPDNAASLLAEENIDGLLIGGASLSPQTFSEIINLYQGVAT